MLLRALRPIILVVGVTVGCRASKPDPFPTRISMFRDFARSIPPCTSATAWSVAELLDRDVAEGERVSVRGQPSPVCLIVVETAQADFAPEPTPGFCERYPTRWVMWAAEPPFADSLRPHGPVCATIRHGDIANGVVLHPTPMDLLDCDAEAIARGAPGFTLIVTGIVLPPPVDANVLRRVDLDVLDLCRVSPSP